MLRPERMSKVSVTGAKSVMPAVIETVHDLNLVHLSDYDGSWEGFDNGDPVEGAETASERLVTIRSLENTLGLDPADEHVEVTIDEEELDARLAAARDEITALEDEMVATQERRRELQDEIDHLSPYAALGIDLDLYTGYETIDVAVGYGNRDSIEEALEQAESVEAYELFAETEAIALFVAPATGYETPIDAALAGVEFSQVDLPSENGDPEQRIARLRRQRQQIESELRSLEADLESLRHEHGDFLRSAERALSIEVDRAEAPLRFATTKRSFVAEGWIPATRYEELVDALANAVGDRVEVEELHQADYNGHEHPHREEAVTDGGHDDAVTMDDEPPVVLRNPSSAKPFELLTNMVNRPKYGELDPTLAVFLTFPLAFGFMIGDIGYGVLYMLMGWWLLRYDSRGFQLVGWIAVWCGAFTVLFGWLFDDTFGVHLLDYDLAVFNAMEVIGLGYLDKGIQTPEWLMTWILASLFFGWLHLNIGFVIRFINELAHGWKAAIYEAGSWILAMNGFLIWLFSHSEAASPIPNVIDFGLDTDLTAATAKPQEFFGPESVIAGTGFEGFPEFMGIIGIVALLVGFVMVGKAEGVAGLAESPAWILGHFLSYLRIVAVLLGKGAMAFVVNLIVFGAYIAEDGYVLFNLPGGDPATAAGPGVGIEEVAFAGLWNMEPAILLIPIAIAVFIVGHIIVLLLGITAAGIQMLRLEYVEFFQKFFEGGGREYDAFGPDPNP